MSNGKRLHRRPEELLNTGAWIALPNEYIDHLLPTMNASEFAVLLVIKRWTHGFGKASRTMGQGMIMDKTGLSRSGVRKALKALQEAGHIVKLRDTDHWRACEWALNEDYKSAADDAEEDTEKRVTEKPKRVTQEPEVGHSVTHCGSQSNPPTLKDNSKIQEVKTYVDDDQPESEQPETEGPETDQPETADVIREGANQIKAACGLRHEQRDKIIAVAAGSEDRGVAWLERWLTWIERGDKSRIYTIPGFVYSQMEEGLEPPGFEAGFLSESERHAKYRRYVQKPGEVVNLGGREDYRNGVLSQRRNDAFANRQARRRGEQALAETG